MAKNTKAKSLLKIGARMADGTIYLGQYKPKDRDGESLSKTFNVFAAPEDLPEVMKYVDTVKHIAKLKNWHGYDGTNYATDKELYAAIKRGKYSGGWVIPTRDILHGKDVDGKKTMLDNIQAHKDTGAFSGTYNKFKRTPTTGSTYPNCPDWYWSSTEDYPDEYGTVGVYGVQLSTGEDGKGGQCKDALCFSSRPVRMVEEAAPSAVRRQPVRSSPKSKRRR